MTDLVKDIFGESDSDDDDDDDEEEETPRFSRLKRGGGEAAAPAPARSPPAPSSTTPPPTSTKKRKAAAAAEDAKEDKGAYDESDEEVEETAEDRAFIDDENDDQDLLREYAQEKQNFSEDRRDGGFDEKEEAGLGAARDEAEEAEARKKKKKGENEEDDANPLTQAMKTMKKKKEKEMTQDEKDKVCMALLGRMNDAYLDDVDARGEGRPATQKMALLPVVKRIFNQRTLHNTLLEFDALGAVCDWLRPLADGSLPSLAVRTAMLEVVQPLPAQPEHLKKQNASGTNVGRVVMKYSRDPRETPSNRRLARQLVEQWSRPVVGRGVSYKSLATQQEDELGTRVVKGTLPKLDPNRDDADDLITRERATVTAAAEQRGQGGADESQRVRVPHFNGFDFVVRPATNALDAAPPARQRSASKSLKFNPESAKGRIAKRVKKSTPGRR